MKGGETLKRVVFRVCLDGILSSLDCSSSLPTRPAQAPFLPASSADGVCTGSGHIPSKTGMVATPSVSGDQKPHE